MMKILVVTLLPILMMASFMSSKAQITATIKGLDSDTVYVWQYPLANIEDMRKDTLIANNNMFTYQIPEEPTAYAIIPHKAVYTRSDGGFYIAQTKFIELFSLPDEQINIEGELEDYYLDYQISGNMVSRALGQLRTSYKSPAIEAVKIELKMDSIRENGGTQDQINELFHTRGQYFGEIAQAKTEYVNNNFDQDLSAYLISRFSLEKFATYYPKLTEDIRNGMFHDILEHSYKNYQEFSAVKLAEQTLTTGKDAPHFELKDNNDKVVSLSDFEGELIVLDFWGTWCSPCLDEIPKLKSFYENNKKDIVLIGIACNEEKDEWNAAIKNYGLEWPQLINSDKNDVAVMYGIGTYPTKIVIDKNLKIVKRFVGATEEFFTEIEELMK
ncbi:AhpC/TSA family protein [Sphingobacterium phlebotomi]|uniref:AhpC/TSA family protein n=1 Tax=Sphingobacterium phlebotomi TaxID=2605433 RepID=A0A5D4H5N7_9SPHI|nr:TlpA disulfide reductase family protein [Sphingobacterium phlebotomi]TYR35824.1 AhpC/TSA family protein [Sphingobacterium phlebotomi]